MKILARYGKVITLPAAFLITLLLSRLFGPEAVGKYSYFSTIVGLASILVVFGTNQSMWTGEKGISGEVSLQQNTGILAITIIPTSIIIVVLWCISAFPKSWDWKTIACCILTTTAMSINATIKNYETFRGRMDRAYWNEITHYSILVICLGIFWQLNIQNIPFAIAGTTAMTLLCFSGVYRKAHNYSKTIMVYPTRGYFKASAKAMAGGLFGLLSYRLSYLVIGQQSGDHSLGLYAMVATGTDACILLISSSVLADMHRIRSGESHLIKKLFISQIILATISAGAISILGPRVISIVYHIEISSISNFTTPLGGMVIFAVGFKYTQNIQLLAKGTTSYLYSNITLLAILLASIAISYKGGPVAIAWATASATAIAAIIQLVRNHQYIWHHETI